MKVIFQTIGVLTQYNWALPYFMVKRRQSLKMLLITNVFSYLMGGFYYHLKQPRKIVPIIAESGVFPELDGMLEKVWFWKCLGGQLIHLNIPSKSALTDNLLKVNQKKVFTLHGSLEPAHIRNLSLARKRLKEIYKKVNAFIAVSEYSAKTIEETCDFKPIVIHNGVDITLFNPFAVSKLKARELLHLPTDNKVILWSGRIEPYKGLHLLIEALPHIVKECNDVIVMVKGRTICKQYLRKLMNLSERLGVKKFLRWNLKWTPNVAMPYYYRACDVYVHTSISEGFSLTLLEAMASGIPVIGNNLSSIPEAIGDPRMLFSNKDELSEKILSVLYDKKPEMFGMEAFNRVISNGFTSLDQSRKYLHLYEEVMH